MTNTDRLTTALADRYRIESHLGEGGMATVYLAEDLKHHRKVAVKVLRPELAAVLGAERFVQEITTTANLQHPHILPLFDSGEADSFLFYVMPFIDGETLRDKLNRETQLGIEEAVKIASEVADALDYAHRHNIIHRDIKPENILLHDGRPMVADFGIALAVSAAAGGRMTETGLSLGTPHYMSPEQATAEKDLTNRSDVYSLGSVLFEMLTGEPPHMGNSAQQIIMKIVTDTPRPVTELRRSVPPNVSAAVAKALEKLPADRFGTAESFSGALQSPEFRYGDGTPVGAATARPTSRARLGVTVAAALVVGFGAGIWNRPGATDDGAFVTRSTLGLDPAPGFQGPRPIHTALAFSPDGRTLVFAGLEADRTRRLFRRPLDSDAAIPIEGTEGAVGPFFSPSGDEVGFWADGRLLRVPLEGGAPVEITGIEDPPVGASWGDDDHIVFKARDVDRLQRVPASGGEVEALASDSGAHLPHVLPGSAAVLYTVAYGMPLEERRVEALTLSTGHIDTILTNASDARYVGTGHLLFARIGALLAVPFDPVDLEVSGAATGVVTDVMHAMNGFNTGQWTDAAQFAVSAAGHLVYVRGGITPSQQREVVWVNRDDGAVNPVDIKPDWYLVARLSPNEDRIALSAPGADGGLMTIDLTRGGAVRQLASGWVAHLSWTPDGRQIFYQDDETHVIAADGSSAPQPVPGIQDELAESLSDGREWLLIGGSQGVRSLQVFSVETGETRLLVEERSGIVYPTISPDGQWLAYALEDGSEIVVRSYPDLEDRTVVAVGPGLTSPVWSRGGRELIYLRSSRPVLSLMAVDFDPVTGRAVGDPTPIPTPDRFVRMGPVRSFDVTQDGERILAIVNVTEAPQAANEIELVLNWVRELEQRTRN